MRESTPPTPDPGQGPARARPDGAFIRARPWLWGALLGVAAIAALWLWRAGTTDATDAPGAAGSGRTQAGGPVPSGTRRFAVAGAAQPVSVQAVRRQDLRVTVNAIGSIVALNTAVVHVQVSGVLQGLNFREGQQVQPGQLLAQIDPRSFQAALAQAEGALARDQAQLDGARVDLARYRDLIAKDAIPRQQLDTQVALVAQLEGTVKVDQAAVQTARLQLSYTRVTAPIAGRVGLKQLDLGNVAQPADANGIASITQTRPIALVFAVPAVHVPIINRRLRASETLAVEAWDRGGKTRLALGRVASVDNAIDPTTDTLKVKAVFPNADDALFPNQAVSVVLQLDTLANVLAVPQPAVLRGAQGFYVYVVNADSTVSTRVVKPGAVDDGWMAVEGALEGGQRVVIDGTDRLREGARVEVIAADPAQRAGASAPPGGGRRGVRAASAAAAEPAASAPASAPAAAARVAPALAASAAPTAPAAPASAASGAAGAWAAAGGERPRWMDRLTPEQAAKVQAMAPEERRAWLKGQREKREANTTTP